MDGIGVERGSDTRGCAMTASARSLPHGTRDSVAHEDDLTAAGGIAQHRGAIDGR